MKKDYETPVLDVIRITSVNIICTSPLNEDETLIDDEE